MQSDPILDDRSVRATRREFLRATTGGALAVSGLSLSGLSLARAVEAAEDDERGRKMRFGLVTYLWGQDWDLPTLLKNCEAAKVLGVELRTTHRHGVEPGLNAEQRKTVKKRFTDSPVTLLGPGSNERFDDPDPEKLRSAIEATKAFVKLSHDVGGTGVKVKPNSFHKGVPREKTIEQIGKSLRTVAKFAADYGQEIRLEVHGQCAELPTIARIVEVAAHPKVVVCWNSNKQDLQGKGLEHNFNLVKKRFGKTVHVRELDTKAYPYVKLFELFVKMDYDGWVCLEASGKPQDRVAALKRQRELFEALVERAKKALAG